MHLGGWANGLLNCRCSPSPSPLGRGLISSAHRSAFTTAHEAQTASDPVGRSEADLRAGGRSKLRNRALEAALQERKRASASPGQLTLHSARSPGVRTRMMR
jgi:hypothetical protein